MTRIDFTKSNEKYRRLTCGIFEGMGIQGNTITIKTNDKREAFLLKHKWIFYLVNRFWYYWYIAAAFFTAIKETFSPSIYIREGKRLKYLAKFIALLEAEGVIEYKEGKHNEF